MTKIEFKNLPDTTTPLNAANLNQLQDNVEDAIDVVAGDIPTIDSSVSTSSTNPVENQAITNYINTINTFTTTEQRIGTWIDNKPLYRITIVDTLGSTNNAWKSIQFFSANYVKQVAYIVGGFVPNNGAYYSIPFFRGTNDNYANREYVLCNFTPSDGTFNIIARHPSEYSVVYAGKTFWMYLYYTKTSDYS